MQLRDAIDAVTADDGKIGHPHAPVVGIAAGIVDQGNAADQLDVTGEALFDLAEKLLIDTVNDAHVTRQQVLHQADWPGLQRFGHQRVVGVGENALALLPGVRPEDAVLVAEQAHQLGDADGRVRIVEVNGDFVGEVVEVAVLFQMILENVLQ